jgi:hypothetical protein
MQYLYHVLSLREPVFIRPAELGGIQHVFFIKDALKPREATKWAFSEGGRPYHIWRLERIWNTACVKAGIKINLYNGLKHSFGCQRLGQEFNKSDLKEVFGHRDMRSVDRYAKYQMSRVGGIMRGKVCANLVHLESEDRNYGKKQEV